MSGAKAKSRGREGAKSAAGRTSVPADPPADRSAAQPAVQPVTQAPVQSLAAYDDRPYFARALDHGLENGIIDSERLAAMRADGAKGIVQIADYFGTAHLRTDLDEALKRMVCLASLYLEHKSDGNLVRAARSLQENSFLSHSRGGSQMLKALYAMPTDTTVHEPLEGDGEKEFLRARSLSDPWNVATYRERFAEREACRVEVEAALWIAGSMALAPESLMGETAENILRACLLTRIAGRTQGGLLNADELKAFLKAQRRAKKPPALNESLLEDVPDAHLDVIGRRLQNLLKKDLPRIRDPKVVLGDLVREYHDLFHPFSMSLEISDYDTLVTEEWRKVTRGMTDTDSMNTVFLCLAAGRLPKPTISAAEAKTMIRAIRTDGAAVQSVPEFIRRCAPHQMIEGLIALWEEEFLPEVIQQWIMDDLDDDLDSVVQMLAEHCHVTKPVRKG